METCSSFDSAPMSSPKLSQAMAPTVAKDSSMLARYNLIDYSLIVGVLVYDLEPCDGQGQPAQLGRVREDDENYDASIIGHRAL